MAVPPEMPVRTRSGPRRDESARLAVLHAADDLLVEVGFAGLSVEAIARRAGVAKQTIYRWWPSKTAILLDTLIEDSEQIAVPERMLTADDLRRYVRSVAHFVTHDPAGKVLLALIAEADHDAGTAERLREDYFAPRRERERRLCTQLATAGLVDPAPDVDAALDAIMGTLVFRISTGRDITGDLVDGLFDTLFRPVAT